MGEAGGWTTGSSSAGLCHPRRGLSRSWSLRGQAGRVGWESIWNGSEVKPSRSRPAASKEAGLTSGPVGEKKEKTEQTNRKGARSDRWVAGSFRFNRLEEVVWSHNGREKANSRTDTKSHNLISALRGLKIGVHFTKLAALVDVRVRATQATIQKALVGDYRKEHLFELKSAFELYHTYEQKIQACDEQIVAETAGLPDKVDLSSKPLPACKQGHPAH